MHIDKDTSEASPYAYSTPVNPLSAEFLPFPRICTRDQKVKFSQSIVRPIVQAMVQPDIHSNHPDNMVKVDKPD